MHWVAGLPIAQGSKKAFRRGDKIVLVESAAGLKEWRYRIAVSARAAGLPLLETEAVSLALIFVMPAPKKLVRKHPTTKPDIDKLARAVCDSLTGIAYKDDSQIVRLDAQKVYSSSVTGLYYSVSGIDNTLVTN